MTSCKTKARGEFELTEIKALQKFTQLISCMLIPRSSARSNTRGYNSKIGPELRRDSSSPHPYNWVCVHTREHTRVPSSGVLSVQWI